MQAMVTLLELLHGRGLSKARVKLARHRDSRYDVDRLVETGFFEYYQSWQRRPVFADCDVVVGLIGLGQHEALLHGVYTLTGVSPKGSARMPAGFPYPDMPIDQHFTYHLERDTRFSDLEQRVVIEWGTGARSWVQWLKPGRDREVVELRRSRTGKVFPGYLHVDLSLPDLRRIVSHPGEYADWHQALSAVGGVYVIRDRVAGTLYVGSAYGSGGFLGRWRDYATNGHGGNVRLKELLGAEPNRFDHLAISILAVLDLSESAAVFIEREQLFKRKLGSVAHGLNAG